MAQTEEALGGPKLTIQLVNDWIGTVLNPLIWGLSRELDVMSRSWTWRQYNGDFEHLAPAKKLVGYHYWPNCEQLFQYQPELAQKVMVYDQAVDQLRTRCTEAHSALLQAPEFKEIVQGLPPVRHSERPDFPRYLAEYTVNGIEELPSDYEIGELWNPRAHIFLDLGSRFEPIRAVRVAGDRLRQAAIDLQQLCTALRDTMADEFGVPRVPSRYA